MSHQTAMPVTLERYNVQFLDNRRFRVCTSDIGFKRFVMYSGVWLLSALIYHGDFIMFKPIRY